MVSFATIKSSRIITSSKCQLPKQWNFVWTRALDNVPSGFGRDPTCFLAKYWSIDITRGSYKISRDKKSQDKNVMDFNVADSVRRNIKVLVTKTRYTVANDFIFYKIMWIIIYGMVRIIFGGQVFCQLVNLYWLTEQGSTEFRTPLCVILATPLLSATSTPLSIMNQLLGSCKHSVPAVN